jgi:hypothetical protein
MATFFFTMDEKDMERGTHSVKLIHANDADHYDSGGLGSFYATVQSKSSPLKFLQV